VGGAKVSDKLPLLENIIDKVDYLFIGGGMCCTFLKAEGYEVGQSAVEEDKLTLVQSLMQKAKRSGVQLLLPSDVIIAEGFSSETLFNTVPITDVPPRCYIMDIGPQTTELFRAGLEQCKMIIWNGPLGVFELAPFHKGTKAIAELLSNLEATTIIGGGSTAEAVTEFGVADKMSHVSTGGGATLRFLGGRSLPAVEALLDKEEWDDGAYKCPEQSLTFKDSAPRH
jgi:phosphoglycerate kinase